MLFARLYFAFTLGFLISIFAGIQAFAESSNDLVAEGNRAYGVGKYDEALEAYEQASVDEPESPYIYFNKGAAQYMKGDYEKAADLFEKAVLKSEDLAFEARSQYNLGNALYRESERQRDSDLQKSLKMLENSITHYQKALKLDLFIEDAAHNIEIARLTMKQILDEIKKQQEEAKEHQEKRKELADRLKELIQKQEKLAENTKGLEGEKLRDKESDANRKRSRKLAADQNNLKGETEDVAEQMDMPPGQHGAHSTKGKEHLERAVSEQSVAEKGLQNESLTEAYRAQQKAAEEMKKALEAMNNAGEENNQQNEGKQEEPQKANQQQPGSPAEPEMREPEQQQKAEAQHDETANDILNEERANREQRQARIPGVYRPVDKDW
jgi:tetratricopeptide (TPR) repeat protein